MKFNFLLPLFFLLIVVTLVGSYFYFQPESFSQIQDIFFKSNSISDYQALPPSINAHSEIEWINNTMGVLTISSAPINFYDYYDGEWKSFLDNVHLQRNGRDLIIDVTNRFNVLMRTTPTLNNQSYTWTQVFNQYPNMEFDLNVFKSKTMIKFDLNLTNGQGMGVNMPNGAGIKIDLINSSGITYNDLRKVDNGILFYDKFLLEIPTACMAEINKTTIWLHNLNETCLDPTISLSQGWMREDGFITDGITRDKESLTMDVGSPFGIVVNRGYMDFDISLLPTSAQVSDVDLSFKVSQANSGNGDIHHLEKKAADQSNLNLFLDSGNGTEYVSNNNYLSSTGDKSVDLGNTANADLQKQNDTNFFGVGLKSTGENDNPVGIIFTSESYFAPTLTVVFTQSGVHIFPNVSLVSPTPVDNLVTPVTTHSFNLSIEEEGLAEMKFNWNGTNTTYYDENLVLMLNFDTYTRLNDTSLTNHRVNSSGDAVWTDQGRYGGAFSFDGNEDFLELGSTGPLNLTNNFTIAFWANDSHTDRPISSFVLGRSPLGATSGGYGFVTGNAGNGYKMRFAATNGTTLFNTASSTGFVTNDSRWHYYVGVVNDTGLHLYVDGEWNASSQIFDVGIKDSKQEFVIGTRPQKDQNWWNGSLDEIRIWKDTTWTIEDVKEHYTNNLYKYEAQK